jgi:hypothetical protein
MARATKPPKRNSWANAAVGSPDIVESAMVDSGWTPAGIVPARGEFNFEQNRYDNALNYLLQRGVSDWDATETDYDVFDIARASNGHFYILVGTPSATAPESDPTNWYLLLRTPQPLTGETAVNEIASWKNAAGRRVTGKDHYGFDVGPFDFREDWMDGAAADKTATAAAAVWFGRWRTAIDNGGGTVGNISLPGPYATDLSTHPWGPIVTVNACGTGVDAVSIVETAKAICKMPGSAMCIEAAFSINGASGPQTNTKASFGIGDGTLAANRTMGSISGSGATAYGAYIEGGGGGNWTAYSRANGGSFNITSTAISVALDDPHRWRCYILGTSDSDDGTARVIQMVDGVIKSNDTVSLLNQMIYPFVRMYANQGEVCKLALGPLRIQNRLVLGDVLL